MQGIIVKLSISADKYKLLYQGAARTVYARATDGRSVQFPADILRPFLLRDGIQGIFRIRFDQKGKYQGIDKLD